MMSLLGLRNYLRYRRTGVPVVLGVGLQLAKDFFVEFAPDIG
jgi:hypothetical protein